MQQAQSRTLERVCALRPLIREAAAAQERAQCLAPEVVEASGMLDLADWLEAANDHDASAHLGVPRAALVATGVSILVELAGALVATAAWVVGLVLT